MAEPLSVAALQNRVRALLDEEDFEGLGEIARRIEHTSSSYSSAEQRALRHLISELIGQVAVIRAEKALEIKRLKGGADARQVYASISSAT